jgi:hypothetical protein
MMPEFEDKTRGGHRVRIYATDGCGPSPIHGALWVKDCGWDDAKWRQNGMFRLDGETSPLDLIPKRPPVVVSDATVAVARNMYGATHGSMRAAWRAALAAAIEQHEREKEQAR